jgi:hypothetical protein
MGWWMCYNIVWRFQNIALCIKLDLQKGSRSGIKGDVPKLPEKECGTTTVLGKSPASKQEEGGPHPQHPYIE